MAKQSSSSLLLLLLLVLAAIAIEEVESQGYWLNGYNPAPIESSNTCNDVRYQDKCYYFGLSLEWWVGAFEACKKIGYHLARVKSIDEANFLAKHLKKTRFREFWVDATDDNHEGIWMSGDQQPSFTGFFAPGEPNGEKYENCGEFVVGDQGLGRLNDQRCNEWNKYICERKVELVCPRAGYQDKCYWFSLHPSNWYQAREHCQSLGMRLARVGGADTAGFIGQHLTGESAWIDVRYGASQGAFTYSDGAALSSNWLNGAGMQPMAGMTMQKCGEVRALGTMEGRIDGLDCMAMRHFVCERNPMATSSAGVDRDELMGLPSGLGSSSAVGRRKRRHAPSQAMGDDGLVPMLLSLKLEHNKHQQHHYDNNNNNNKTHHRATQATRLLASTRLLRA